MHTGICPKCGRTISQALMEGIEIAGSTGKRFHGVSIQCPNCKVVLSAAIDPWAIKTEIIAEIVDALRPK